MGRELRETAGKMWAVHETVSEAEGPITPAFRSKADLIEHLVAHGTAWDEPWTRAAAKDFVYRTWWAPSFIVGPLGVKKGYEAPAKEGGHAGNPGQDRR